MNIFLMSLLIFLVEMESDMYIPSILLLPDYFGISISYAQLTISGYLIGLAVSAPFYGILADIYGRKSVILAGTAVFTLATLTCYLSENFYIFAFSRIMQGIGGGSGMLGYACVSDAYSGDRRSQILSRISTILAISPAIGPILGGWVAGWLGWKMIFLMMFFPSLILLLGFSRLFKETATRTQKISASSDKLHSYISLFRVPGFSQRCFFISLIFAGLWANTIYMPLIFESVGVHYDGYGIYVAIMVLAYIVGTIINQTVVMHINTDNAAIIGSIIIACSDFVLLMKINSLSTALITISCSCGSIGLGMVISNAVSGALGTLPKEFNTKGSAAIASIQTISSALGLQICGIIAGNNLATAILVMLIYSSLASIYAIIILTNKTAPLQFNEANR